jgi:hypothetical protein
MSFSKREAAENLLKLAADLEREAFDHTYFVCDKCSHTANLTTINDKRAKTASERGIKKVNAVTVNERLACPACDGVMSYVPTEESQRYYVEAADDMKPEEIAPPTDMPSDEPPAAPVKKEPAPGLPDNGDIFDPVDERDKKDDVLDLGFGDEDVDEKKPEDVGAPEELPPKEEGAPEEQPPKEEGAPGELPPKEDVAPEDLPPKEEGAPEEMPVDESVPPVTEEEVPMDGTEPKKKSKKKDKYEFPKEDVPKFEKMPKDASDALYQASLKKYVF